MQSAKWTEKVIAHDPEPLNADDGLLKVELPPGVYAVTLSGDAVKRILKIGQHEKVVLIFNPPTS